MAIKTNVPSGVPARERLKREIALPSGGYSARAAFPEGRVMVRPWDQDVSDYLLQISQRPDFLSLVCGRILNVSSDVVKTMVSSELVLVALVSRAIVDDNKVSYTATCPHCGTVQKRVTIAVPDDLGKVGEKAPDYPGYDDVTLPKSGDVVRLSPMLVSDELTMESWLTDHPKESRSLAKLAATVKQVNGGVPDNVDETLTWLRMLHPADVEYLVREQARLTPGVDLGVPHTCDDTEKCGKPFRHPLRFDYEFFLPGLRH